MRSSKRRMTPLELMPATAAWTAAARIEIDWFGNAAELEGFTNVLADSFLHFVHLLLGIDEAAADRVIEKFVALLFEFGNFFVSQADALHLFVLKILAFFAERLVLSFGIFVGHKGVNLLT